MGARTANGACTLTATQERAIRTAMQSLVEDNAADEIPPAPWG